MVATPAKVIAIIQEPEAMNCVQQRIFTYLNQMVGDMKAHDVASVLRLLPEARFAWERRLK